MKRMKKTKNVKIVSREMRVKQFKDVPPSQIFYNPSTTKWFRHRYNEDLIKKSIYSLFPNNCAPMLKEEEVTPMSILLEWLSHYLKPEKKYANIWINPKYFFSKSVYDKILKLKEIFLQFDEDGSRKMEIDEMVTMFKTNHIDVTEDDLCSLFFKGKKFRKEDINKLYLDFYQFMQFALSKASDQDFRIFIRKIKEKIMKEKENEKNKRIIANQRNELSKQTELVKPKSEVVHDAIANKYLPVVIKHVHGIDYKYTLDENFYNSTEYSMLKAMNKQVLDLVESDGHLLIGSHEVPVKNFHEVYTILMKEGFSGVKIQRYKGLGEMSAEQLSETTMNPDTRTLLKVNITDAMEADRLFTELMGEDVEQRKVFIAENASKANLDI